MTNKQQLRPIFDSTDRTKYSTKESFIVLSKVRFNGI